jgi:hypothetical protein
MSGKIVLQQASEGSGSRLVMADEEPVRLHVLLQEAVEKEGDGCQTNPRPCEKDDQPKYCD